jgi:hypothetical protein
MTPCPEQYAVVHRANSKVGLQEKEHGFLRCWSCLEQEEEDSWH